MMNWIGFEQTLKYEFVQSESSIDTEEPVQVKKPWKGLLKNLAYLALISIGLSSFRVAEANENLNKNLIVWEDSDLSNRLNIVSALTSNPELTIKDTITVGSQTFFVINASEQELDSVRSSLSSQDHNIHFTPDLFQRSKTQVNEITHSTSPVSGTELLSNLTGANALNAYKFGYQGEGQEVSILDSVIHPGLRSTFNVSTMTSFWENGQGGFVPYDELPDTQHATWVTGALNSIASKTTIHSYAVCQGNYCSASAILRALEHSSKNHPDSIISMSFGGFTGDFDPPTSSPFCVGINSLPSSIQFVASAGNNNSRFRYPAGSNYPNYYNLFAPGGCPNPNIIAVGSMEWKGSLEKIWYSNFNDPDFDNDKYPILLAGDAWIYTTNSPTQTVLIGGTSLTTSIIDAAVVLTRERRQRSGLPDLTPIEMEIYLRDTGICPTTERPVGCRVDIDNALKFPKVFLPILK